MVMSYVWLQRRHAVIGNVCLDVVSPDSTGSAVSSLSCSAKEAQLLELKQKLAVQVSQSSSLAMISPF